MQTPSKQLNAPASVPASTPGTMQDLFTPLDCTSPQRWGFTPISTPSPSGRFASYEQMCSVTPGARAAAALRSQSILQGWSLARAAALASGTEDSTSGREQLSKEAGPQTLLGFDQPSILDNDDEEESDSDESSAPLEHVALSSNKEVPDRPEGVLHPSVGSASHAIGACKRCCFFPRGRCMNGYNCEFCHYEHEKRKRKSKNKGQKVYGKPLLPLSAVRPALGRPVLPHTLFAQQSISQPLHSFAVHAGGANMLHGEQLAQVTLMDLGLHSMVGPTLQGAHYVPSYQAPPVAVQAQPPQYSIYPGGAQASTCFLQGASFVQQTSVVQQEVCAPFPMSTAGGVMFGIPHPQPAATVCHLAEAVVQRQLAIGCTEIPPPPVQPPNLCRPLGM